MPRKDILLMLMLIVILAGCKADKPEEKQPAKETSGEKIEEKLNTFPLTGETTKEEVDHRAIAVVVNNHPKARPQSGLREADLVYEMLAESNITRFLAIYQSEFPEKIGPVRSARDYYVRTAKAYDGLFVFHGWSPDAKKLIESGYIDNINGLQYDGTLFKRVSFRKAPHNSYVTYDSILKGAEKKKIDMDTPPAAYAFYSDKDEKAIQGENATTIKVSYSSASFNVTYEYDADQGSYTRYTAGEQTTDYDSKKPIEIDNLFIIEAPHKIIDNHGHRHIDLTAGGKGYLIQKGVMNEITWESKNGRVVPIIDGQAAKLVSGKTWINVIPSASGLEKDVTFTSE